jgi:ribosomal protein S18 acetylase RimI-like enzyme
MTAAPLKEGTPMSAPTARTAEYATDLDVRKAAAQDLPALVETLSAAFFTDPFMSWWIPDPERRRVLLPACFEIIVDVHHPLDELYTTGPVPAAGAVWAPPGGQPSPEEAEEVIGWLAEAAEETAERALYALERMDEAHPRQPHAYLFLLGTRPAWQGRGLGSMLLREVLQRCDRDRTPAYLEATSPENVRLYRRHGFEVTGEICLPDGPSLWPMWRAPNPAQGGQ